MWWALALQGSWVLYWLVFLGTMLNGIGELASGRLTTLARTGRMSTAQSVRGQPRNAWPAPCSVADHGCATTAAAALAYFFAAVSPTMDIAVGALPLVSGCAWPAHQQRLAC